MATKLNTLLIKDQQIMAKIQATKIYLNFKSKHKITSLQKMKKSVYFMVLLTQKQQKESEYDSETSKNEIKEFFNLIKKLEENKKKIRLVEKWTEEVKNKNIEIKSLFVTFNYRKQRDLFHEILPSSRLLAWNNLDKSDFFKILRRFLSWAIFFSMFIVRKFFNLTHFQLSYWLTGSVSGRISSDRTLRPVRRSAPF
jgi:hypothetical protein